MKLPGLGTLRVLYNQLWRYRDPRLVWETWGRSYARDAYLSSHFAQDDWLKETLLARAPGPVLEVGCGAGRLLAFLEEARADGPQQLAGVDFSMSMLHVARQSLRSPRLAASDARSLPFRSGSFDWIYTHGCLMHLRHEDDVRLALTEFRRVARRGLILIEETMPDGRALPRSGFTPNGLAYYWDYDALLSRAGGHVVERRRFKNIETVGCWLVEL